MGSRLSGIDAMSPAFARTKTQLFAPFRFKHWLRLAVVCVLTGEITGGGGGSGYQGMNFRLPPSGGGRRGADLLALPGWLVKIPSEVFFWGAFAVIAVVLLLLLILYVSSVYRFILFDSVLYNRCGLREGWRNWQQAGSSYFLWQIGYGLASLAAMAAVVGVPVLLAWRAGWFSDPDKHIAALVLGGFAVFMLFAVVLILSAVGSLFTKDFVIPVMALEGRGTIDGWRRFLPLLGREKGGYAFYVLMKIVLAIGSALLFGIIEFMVIFVAVIGIGLAGVAIFLLAKGAGATWNPLTISLTVVAGAAVLLLLLAVTAIISTPAMVFFQAYSIHFFGSRYPALGTIVSPPEVPPPAMPTLPLLAPLT
jgi:hypothetical protein